MYSDMGPSRHSDQGIVERRAGRCYPRPRVTDNPDLIATEARELTGDVKATGPKTFGRKEEVHTLARLLAHKKSVVLVGPAGVGKTAIIQKLVS
ncbi:hypothetical protein BH09MYX1_BH09MYX1_50870 [soil metagenome]